MKQTSLKSNFLFNLIYQILAVITPIFTTPYISRVLSADGIGKYSYALSIVTYFGIFGCLGTATYGQLEIARNRDNKKLLHKTVSEIFFGRLVTLMISLLIYFAVILKASGQYKLLYSVLSLYILGQMNDVSFILQGLEWFKMLAMRNIIIKVLNIVLIFALVREHNDLYIYAIIIHGITLIGNFSLWPQVIKYIKPKSFKNMNFIQHWKKSMIYFIPTVATMVYTVLDKSMIGWITGSEFQNGYYEQAYKIEQILLVFVTTVGTVTFPRMAYFFENDNKEERKRIMGITMKFIMLIACPICFGTMAISENLIPVFQIFSGFCLLLLKGNRLSFLYFHY